MADLIRVDFVARRRVPARTPLEEFAVAGAIAAARAGSAPACAFCGRPVDVLVDQAGAGRWVCLVCGVEDGRVEA